MPSRDQNGTTQKPNLKLQSTYNELTDSSSRIRRIVSASNAATDNWRMRPQALACGDNGTVSVTTNSSSTDFEIESTALPDRMACVMYATTFCAPSFFSACAAMQSVPAVSTMSSTSTQVLPFTSPMMFITFDSFGRGRRLSMIARSASSRRFAKARARTTPPTSGDTTITFRYACFQASPNNTGDAYKLSTGMSKNPSTWFAC